MAPVNVLSEQETSWITHATKRLRLVQAEVASAPPEERRSCLRDEIDRNLENVPAPNRKRLLQALLGHFPTAGQMAQAPAPVAPPAVLSVPAPPKTPEEILDSFLARAGELTEERRAALIKKLGQAGFGWIDREALVLEIADELRQALGLPIGQQPQLTRLVQLALLLIDLFYRLDHTALKTLSELAPRSPLLARSQDFREAVAAYLTGTSESIEPQVRAMSALVGGMLAAMLGAGKDFGRQYVERFSPSAIEDVIKGEGKVKWWVPGSPTEKELCWDKYKDLARDFATTDLIDRRIRDCLATFVEKKVPAGR